MAWKNLSQLSLADALVHEHEALKELDDFNELIDWQQIEDELAGLNANPMGEKAWPPLLMFKILLLQSWYNLSDPACEKQLARDMLFRRFIGLSHSDPVPDHSTIWRFRNKLQEETLYERLHENINNQLTEKSLILKAGEVSIIDASVIKAKNNRPNKNAQGESTQDEDASYSTKASSNGKKKTTYGYKAHVNVDEDGYIKSQTLTTAAPHDSNVFEELLSGSEKEVYADSAYKSEKHDELLESKRIKNMVLHKGHRNNPLTEEQKVFNLIASQTRCVVERTFGVLKKYYGLGQARYLGIERNQARLSVICIAHNIKRAVNIQRSCI